MRLEGILMVKADQGKAYRFRGAGATCHPRLLGTRKKVRLENEEALFSSPKMDWEKVKA